MKGILKEIETKPFQQILPQVNKLKYLLKGGKCDVDGQNSDGDTLLHIVVKSGNLRGHNTIQEGEMKPENMFDIAYLTGSFNPNPFIKNKKGMTPSMLAAHLKLTSVWQFLTSYEHVYKAKYQEKILEKILSQGNNLNEKQKYYLKKVRTRS